MSIPYWLWESECFTNKWNCTLDSCNEEIDFPVDYREGITINQITKDDRTPSSEYQWKMRSENKICGNCSIPSTYADLYIISYGEDGRTEAYRKSRIIDGMMGCPSYNNNYRIGSGSVGIAVGISFESLEAAIDIAEAGLP